MELTILADQNEALSYDKRKSTKGVGRGVTKVMTRFKDEEPSGLNFKSASTIAQGMN